MSNSGDIQGLLHEHRHTAFGEDSPADHIPDEILAMHVATGEPFGDEHVSHLAVCAECRGAVGSELVLADAEVRTSSWLRRTLLATGAVAIAAGALFAAMPEDQGRTKGSIDGFTGDVTVLAIDAKGGRRDLVDGAKLTSGEKLGFRYGNPEGRHESLTILGWDGKTVHWYYPAAKDRPATPVRRDQRALSVRLPEDVGLEDHRPGPLTIVAAFDAKPKEVAASLKRGDLDAMIVLRLVVTED